jgi:hypothetical protein
MRHARWILLFSSIHLIAYTHGVSEPSSISACAVALTPLVQITKLSDHVKYAWLDLITRDDYDAGKTAIKASGDVELLDLIKIGDAEADYDTFNEHRHKYLETHQGQYNQDLALSTFSQSLPPSAHQKWLECVRAVVRSPGLHAWFEQESATTARLVTKFYGTPGDQVSVSATIIGATPAKQTFILLHDAEHGIALTRRGSSNIVVDLEVDKKLTAGAASAFPTKSNSLALFVSPYVVTPQTATPVSNKKCVFELRNFTSAVEAPLVADASALILSAGPGGSVEPSTDPLNFQMQRGLDDIALQGPAKLEIKVGNLTAPLAIVKPGDEGCLHPILRLPASKVQVRYLQPVNELVPSDPVTAQVVLNKYATDAGDYKLVEGNIGCPPAGGLCGNSWRAQITFSDKNGSTIPIFSFDSISQVSSQNTGHWYSCTDGLCGSNGDFTETSSKTSPKCIGKPTCWVWRHEDDGHNATDTFSVTYRAAIRKCIRNCPTVPEAPNKP